MSAERLTVLELFCGIGGCAAALGPGRRVAAAIDINQRALFVYRHNFEHVAVAQTIEAIRPRQFERWQVDLWWMSPPCQPYTQRGRRRDLDDPRAASLLALMRCIEQVRPRHLALENVPGFRTSQARLRLIETLDRCGYEFLEQEWCPTQFGIPNRRRRYYLAATRNGSLKWPPVQGVRRRLSEFLDADPPAEMFVDPIESECYARALDRVDVEDPDAITACFTAGYGRSPIRSGSYLQTATGLRRCSPLEILRLLGFPETFVLPPTVTNGQAWRLVGNSLSVPVVRHVLSAFRPSVQVPSDDQSKSK